MEEDVEVYADVEEDMEEVVGDKVVIGLVVVLVVSKLIPNKSAKAVMVALDAASAASASVIPAAIPTL